MATVDEMQVVINAKTEGMRSELAKAAQDVRSFAEQSRGQVEKMIGLFGQLQTASSPQQMLGLVGGVVGKSNPMFMFAEQAFGVFEKLSTFHEKNLKWSTELINTSAAVGLTTTRVQEMAFAAEKAGVQNSALTDGLVEFKKRADQAAGGTGPLVKLLEEQGIAMKFADGTMKSYDQILRELADAMKRVEDDGKRGKIALEAFGETGRQLVPIFKAGSQGLDDFAMKARQAGQVSSEAMVQTISFIEIEWKRRVDSMKDVWQKLLDGVLAGLNRVGSKTVGENWMPTAALEATARQTHQEWMRLKAEIDARAASDFAIGAPPGRAIGLNSAGETIYDRAADDLNAMRQKLAEAENAFNEASAKYRERLGLNNPDSWNTSVQMPPPQFKNVDEDKGKPGKAEKEPKDHFPALTEYLERQIRQNTAYAEGLNKTKGEVAALRAEEEILARAKHYDITITAEMRAELDRLKEKLRETVDAAERWKQQLQVIQDVGRAVSSNLESAFRTFTETGKFNFKSMAQSIVRDLEMVAFRALVIAPLFGTGGSNQGLFGSALAGMLGAVGGGGAAAGTGWTTTLAGTRAEGGPVAAGSMYRVNEYGQEFFIPGMSGVIVPAGAARQVAPPPASGPRSGGEVVVTLRPSDMFDAHIEQRTTGAVARVAPEIVRASVGETRKALPGMITDARRRQM